MTVNADINFNKDYKTSTSVETSSRTNSSENSTERKHRRRMMLKNNALITNTTTSQEPTTKLLEVTTPFIETIQQETQSAHPTNSEVRQEKLTDQIELAEKIDPSVLKEAENSPPVKRFYRSSAESESPKEEKEMTMVNNEKVQIIRPTSLARLVGEFPTPSATIAELDQAVLGTREKKEVVTIVTPERHENVRSQSHRFRT